MATLEFYKDKEKGLLDPTLFERAREKAEELNREGKLKSSQFRNYFAELRALENRFQKERKADEALAFARLVPELELLKAKLAYNTRSQGPLREAKAFVGFLNEALDAGKRSPKDFEAMMKYVEAVLAYFYALGK
ncbi:CRISPR-associated protein, Csm2 [Thermus sp. CCB_US3_UF1]|uniref:type III-A CRISPR-associated protein Csm2 n=1 Tax=unclassified Thermus TaxID=2619321 RepID=UPI00023896B1|nr:MULTISPECIES: type III-A CRISPR-associated protein Csm2 [unclassified Thermus]AEV16373.1 CRISPR-associated protein, Csm2 [Thermus sp. CCB_US3_UF1]MCS6867403.1 type III-A CRISPR-associated protein Csm2 [Thermus sp.]